MLPLPHFYVSFHEFIKHRKWIIILQISENERAQQSMSLMPGGSDYDLVPSQSFDSRNYFQVNALQPSSQYARQDQTPLQLV